MGHELYSLREWMYEHRKVSRRNAYEAIRDNAAGRNSLLDGCVWREPRRDGIDAARICRCRCGTDGCDTRTRRAVFHTEQAGERRRKRGRSAEQHGGDDDATELSRDAADSRHREPKRRGGRYDRGGSGRSEPVGCSWQRRSWQRHGGGRR